MSSDAHRLRRRAFRPAGRIEDVYARPVDTLTCFIDDDRQVPRSEGLLEIYKLSVEMADRVSARRAIASSFFLIVQSGLVAFLAFVHGQRWSIAAS
jgi:hypothetical protein